MQVSSTYNRLYTALGYGLRPFYTLQFIQLYHSRDSITRIVDNTRLLINKRIAYEH